MPNTQISKSVISKSIKLLQTAIISICVVTMSSITFAESEKHNDDSSLQIRHSTPPAKINIEELSEALELNKVQSQQLKVLMQKRRQSMQKNNRKKRQQRRKTHQKHRNEIPDLLNEKQFLAFEQYMKEHHPKHKRRQHPSEHNLERQ